MSTVAPVQQDEVLSLPATRRQPLRLQLTRESRFNSLNCAAYVRARTFHVAFVCTQKADDWRIDESSNGDCTLWITSTAFALDQKHADRARTFLAGTKATP